MAGYCKRSLALIVGLGTRLVVLRRGGFSQLLAASTLTAVLVEKRALANVASHLGMAENSRYWCLRCTRKLKEAVTDCCACAIDVLLVCGCYRRFCGVLYLVVYGHVLQ